MPKKKTEESLESKPVAPSVLLAQQKKERAEERLRKKAETLANEAAKETLAKAVARSKAKADVIDKEKARSVRVNKTPRATINDSHIQKSSNQELSLVGQIAAFNSGTVDDNSRFSFVKDVNSLLEFLNSFMLTSDNYMICLYYVEFLKLTSDKGRDYKMAKTKTLQRKLVNKINLLTTIKQWECGKNAYSYINKNYSPDNVKVCLIPYTINSTKLFERYIHEYNSMFKKTPIDIGVPNINPEDINLYYPAITNDVQHIRFISIDISFYKKMNISPPQWLTGYIDLSKSSYNNVYAFESSDYFKIKSDYINNNYVAVKEVEIDFLAASDNINFIII